MTDSNAQSSSLLFVTGLSGAGMSSALKSLEDLGYEVFDNFPLSLVPPLLEGSEGDNSRIAIGLDTRTRGFDQDAVLQAVKDNDAKLVFITADENILLKRFTETRRKHPLANDRPASAGIKHEQNLVYGLRGNADLVIDTTELSIHDLRRVIEENFKTEGAERLTISLVSFGFRHGLPREADLVMDVRFLQNPHWLPDLKPQTGLDKPVGDYIEKDENFATFLTNLKALVSPLLPRYVYEGKSYLTIGIGCTGGHHRSVYTVETLKPWFEDQGFVTYTKHRDIDR
jgi:UPF0042 nucleotide-binding protein